MTETLAFDEDNMCKINRHCEIKVVHDLRFNQLYKTNQKTLRYDFKPKRELRCYSHYADIYHCWKINTVHDGHISTTNSHSLLQVNKNNNKIKWYQIYQDQKKKKMSEKYN